MKKTIGILVALSLLLAVPATVTATASDSLDDEESQEANPCQPYAWDGTVKDLIRAVGYAIDCLIGPAASPA